MKKSIALLSLLTLTLFTMAGPIVDGTLTLAWNAPSETNGLSGYRVYFGQIINGVRQPTNFVNAGLTLRYAFSNSVWQSNAYFFYATAYSTNDCTNAICRESLPSNEVIIYPLYRPAALRLDVP